MHRLLQPARPVGDIEGRIEHHRLEGAIVQSLDGLKLLVAQNRAVQPHQMRIAFSLIKQIAARANQHAH